MKKMEKCRLSHKHSNVALKRTFSALKPTDNTEDHVSIYHIRFTDFKMLRKYNTNF